MTKRILSVVLALLMMINVFAITSFAAESDNHATWKLACSNESPMPGDVLSIDVSLQADYVTNTFGALIVYDKNYYEPAESVEGNNIVIASDIVDYGNKTVIMSEKKAASVAAKLYDASYTDEMKEQYAIAWFSFVFQASKFGDPTSDEIPSYATMTKVATLKLKVKDGASSDGNGLIWMDPVYIQTSNGSAKYTFVARGTSEIVGQCTTAAKFGQTVDVSDCVLYKAAEQPACQHANTIIINAKDATCTEAGYTGDTYCNDCQQVIAEGQNINALGHDEVALAAVPATCQATGLTAGSKCNRCGVILVAQQETPLADHTPVVDELVPATCQATGLTEGSHCSVCGTVLVAQQVIPVTDHTPGEWTVVTPATCQATGTKTKSCTVCGTVLESDVIPLADHTAAIDAAVAPTCTETGLTEGSHCSVCGAVIVAQEVVGALGHDFGEWTVVTPATYTSVGTERRDCSRCDAYEEKDIPMLEDTDADYSAVAAALANVPEDLSIYTQASVKALNNAIQAVEYGLPASQQATVDAFAADIQTAINNLKLIPTSLANYADLDDYIAKFVPATSNKTNGVYDADELAAIDELIASFDRQLPSSEQATVNGYLTSLKVAVAALTIDETKAVAEFAITTDKTEAVKDDVITVSVNLKTNYPIYTMSIPVIYDATAFELVIPNSSDPQSHLTFTGSLANAYKLGGNHTPTNTVYKRNSNPNYWSTQTQYKVLTATWTADSTINKYPVTLEDGEVIITFQLKVISDAADTTGNIFLNSDWIKTDSTKGGVLFAGRSQGSVFSPLAGAMYGLGQTIDLDDAEAIVTLNATHEHIRGAWAIEEDKYVCRCTECGEIVESKNLPLATIASAEGVGDIENNTATVITITADELVGGVRLVDATDAAVNATVATTEGGYIITKTFAYTGSAAEYTVQYKLGETWLDIDTISVNVARPAQGNANVVIIGKEGVGTITAGTVTKITVATVGDVEKVGIFTEEGKMLAADVTANEGGFVITRTFNTIGRDLTVKVGYRAAGIWTITDESFTVNVVKSTVVPADGVADVYETTNVGEITVGDVTTIKVRVESGNVQKVGIRNAAGATLSADVVKDGNYFIITRTFTYNGGNTYDFKVMYKTNNKWYDCESGNLSVTVKKAAAPVVPETKAKVIETSNVGEIKAGDVTTIKVAATSGTIQKVDIRNAAGATLSATITEADGVYTITRAFAYNGGNAYDFKVMYKANGTWYVCEDGELSVTVTK